MPTREFVHSVAAKQLLADATVTTPQTTATLDTQNYDSATFLIRAGATAPAPTSIVMNESDDDSTYTPVAAAEIIGTADVANWAVSKTLRLGYVGTKRYVQLVITPNGSTIVGVTGLLGLPDQFTPPNPGQ
jgi:hypothetical protein